MKKLGAIVALFLAGCVSGQECRQDNPEACTTDQLQQMTNELNRDTLRQLEKASANNLRAAEDLKKAVAALSVGPNLCSVVGDEEKERIRIEMGAITVWCNNAPPVASIQDNANADASNP